MDNVIAAGASLNTIRGNLFNHHLDCLPKEIPVPLQADLILTLLKPLQPFTLDLLINLIFKLSRAGIGSVGILEGKGTVKPDCFQQVHGLLKIMIRFTGKPGNDIGANGDFRTKRAQSLNFFQIEFSGILTVHFL